MLAKRKAAPPVQAGTLGRTAFENQANNTSCSSPGQSAAAIQRRTILKYLRHDTLTTLQARDLGIMHPAARCMKLRKQGHEIVTEWTREYCPGGVLHRVARYRLRPQEGAA